MSRDSGPVMPLEQRNIRPGKWLIEGYTVTLEWNPDRPAPHTEWQVAGTTVAFPLLNEVRDWIREQQS